MGNFINKGNDGFASVLKTNFVDKSMLIQHVCNMMNTENRYMCVTRARRFGKSLAIKMLNAYFDQSCSSERLFNGLEISNCFEYKKHLNQYPVLYLDLTDFITKYGKDELLVDKIKRDIADELIRLYKRPPMKDGMDLMDLLVDIVEETGQKFICLIDEWDALCREGFEKQTDEYVDLLRRLFKGSKTESVFSCVYITGILPIKRYNTQSALNNFEEYTMLSPAELSSYFGFTENEVIKLCNDSGMNHCELKRWYDGYKIGDERSMYNPYAVMRSIKRRRYENYWTTTNTFESLKHYITMNFDGLKDDVTNMLADIPVTINTLSFSNDMHRIDSKDDVLTLLCHLGYLSYNWENKQATIPNYEVRQEFETAISTSDWEDLAQTLAQSEDMLKAVLDEEEELVAQYVSRVHQENTSILKYNNENSLACVLTLAFYTARNKYLIVREFPTGKGFADLVLIPFKNTEGPVIVLELKYNNSAETAISQIKNNRYTSSLEKYSGEVILVGINYDKKTKEHTCLIERVTYQR